MACLNPLEGWIASKANDSGRYSVVFRLCDGSSDRRVAVPCGKCPGCTNDRAVAWAVRCYHESTQHDRNCFVTLTYRDPCPARLQVEDLQRFFKRLRRAGREFRYFGVGEYGGRTHRPHYHCLLFGLDFLEDAQYVGPGPKSENEYYLSPFLAKIWTHGNVLVAPCEGGSIFYTCGYALKNLDDPDAFHVCSRRPYIGHGWLAKYFDDISRNGFVTIDGIRRSVPKAYLVRKEFLIEFDALKDQRKVFISQLSPDDVWERRQARPGQEVNLVAAAQLRRGEL